jgi:hypothetical protein
MFICAGHHHLSEPPLGKCHCMLCILECNLKPLGHPLIGCTNFYTSCYHNNVVCIGWHLETNQSVPSVWFWLNLSIFKKWTRLQIKQESFKLNSPNIRQALCFKALPAVCPSILRTLHSEPESSEVPINIHTAISTENLCWGPRSWNG